MLRNEPPLKDITLYYCDGWWGSPYVLMRSERPTAEDFLMRELPELHEMVITPSAEALPGDGPITFGPSRWGGRVSIREVVGHAFSVDSDFLDYAEAETEPDEWRLVVTRPGGLPSLVGVKGGEAVAVIAPIRTAPTPDDQEAKHG